MRFSLDGKASVDDVREALGMFYYRHRAISSLDPSIEILHEVASDMNKLKRELALSLPLLAEMTVTAWQVTSCSKTSAIGSLLLIHGKTITLPMKAVTRRLQRGSFKAKLSQNGNYLNLVRCCGSTGNVSRCPAIMLSQRLMDIIFCSGCRKECILVRVHFDFSFLEN